MTTKNVEVELKFPLPSVERVREQLRKLGTQFVPDCEQIDEYWAHPSRDFRDTDEAFRIRSVGTANCLTYKGPKLSSLAKARTEIEIPFAEGTVAREQMVLMLQSLSFHAVHKVRKIRSAGHLAWQGWQLEIAIDSVTALGTFLEIEIGTHPEQMNAAIEAVWSLAEHLNLRDSEQRSYLELLLTAQSSAG